MATRRKRVIAKESALSVVLRALSQKYPYDYWSPGIQVAWVASKGSYYAAIHRYESGVQRRVVSKALADTLPEALRACLDSVVNRESLKIDRALLRAGEAL